MALFDIFTDVFTGAPAKEAAASQRQYLSGQQQQIGNTLGNARLSGLAALQSGQAGALGAVGPGFDTARADITGSLAPAVAALNPSAATNYLTGYTGAATNALAQAVQPAATALQTGVGQAVQAYAPVSATAQRFGVDAATASQMEADALGLNGPEGIARARSSFQTSPGYEFKLGEGINAITRAANAGGMLASGNTLRESQTYGQGLANQEYNDWMNRLMGRQQLYSPLELSGLSTAAGGQANAYLTGGKGLADIYMGTGSKLADIYAGAGRSLADVSTGYGRDVASLYGTTGRSLADLASRGALAMADIYGTGGRSQADLERSIAQSEAQAMLGLASPYASTFGTEAEAELGGSKNLWGLLGGLASFGAGAGAFGPMAQQFVMRR